MLEAHHFNHEKHQKRPQLQAVSEHAGLQAKIAIPRQFLPESVKNDNKMRPTKHVRQYDVKMNVGAEPSGHRLKHRQPFSFGQSHKNRTRERHENENMNPVTKHQTVINSQQPLQTTVPFDEKDDRKEQLSEPASSDEQRSAENIQRTEVQVTAGFNLLASDIFLECQSEVESTFEKVKSVFPFGSKHFNQQQVAFVLKTAGILDELDDEFRGKTSEDQLLINLFYSSLKIGRKGVSETKLKDFLCLLKGLLKNDLFQRKTHRSQLSESKLLTESSRFQNIKSSSDDSKAFSFSKTQKSANFKAKLRSSRGKFENSEKIGKDDDILPNSQENRGSNIQLSESRNFSFKKRPEVIGEMFELRREFVESEQVTEKSAKRGTASRNLLDELSECWAKKKAERKAIVKKICTHTPRTKSEENTFRSRWARRFLTPDIKKSSLTELPYKNPLLQSTSRLLKATHMSLQELKDCPRRGRFLFSSFVRTHGKLHSIMVYEFDDLMEEAKRFAEENNIEIDKCFAVFEQIDRQRKDFTKSFSI